MPTAALDYSKVAAIYDEYCLFDSDIEFLTKKASRVAGRVLELMAGTGRVSLPLAMQGISLTCVDSSPAMLAVLKQKLRASNAQASILCSDATDLPIRVLYALVILPFNGFNELPTARSQMAVLRSVADVLADAGSFICTAHNPEVRLRTIDGSWHELGEIRRSDGGTLRLSVRGNFDASSSLVVGQQRITVTTASGDSSVLNLSLRFSLTSLERLTGLAAEAGLRLVSVSGDYTGARYEPRSSPSIIAVLRKLT